MALARLKKIFQAHPPIDLTKNFSDYACVAIILKPLGDSFEVAFIRRAHNPSDQWAGHIAFPGGRRDEIDPNDLATALRETKEEVGWELSENHFLGFLTDIQARNRTGLLNFFLRPLVFFTQEELPLHLIAPEEVDEVFWISIDHLYNLKNRTSISIPTRGLDLPAIQFPAGDKLWGLTYMMTQELLRRLEMTKLIR